MPAHPDPEDRNVLEPGCERCPALVAGRTCITWGNGALDADVMVVGEAPGAGDPDAETWRGGNHTGLAYTSRHSGRRIRALFEALGHADGTYYTNAVKCFPSEAAPPGTDPGDVDPAAVRSSSNREPAPSELDNCRDHLKAELEQVDPVVVAPTGKHATTTLLAVEGRSVDSFLDRVLDPVECPTLGVTLLPLLHPSYQDVWLSRLGYTPEGYREAVGEALAACGVPAPE